MVQSHDPPGKCHEYEIYESLSLSVSVQLEAQIMCFLWTPEIYDVFRGADGLEQIRETSRNSPGMTACQNDFMAKS